MLLTEFLNVALDAKVMPVCSGTRNNWYLPAIADYRDCLGTDPRLEDMCRDRLNAWIDRRVSEGRLSCYTIKTRRGALLSIWRAAVEHDLLDVMPAKIRQVRMRRTNPTAWDRAEVQRLFSYSLHNMPDKRMPMTDLPQRVFFASLISAGYDTALRLGDLLSIEREWIRTDKEGAGWMSIQQSKTGLLVASRINPTTMGLIDRLMSTNSDRRLIWPLGFRREALYRQFKRLVKQSGVRSGTFRFLRRASTTHVEMDAPGTAYRHAGHSDPATTRRYYLDHEQLSGAVSPQALDIIPPP